MMVSRTPSMFDATFVFALLMTIAMRLTPWWQSDFVATLVTTFVTGPHSMTTNKTDIPVLNADLPLTSVIVAIDRAETLQSSINERRSRFRSRLDALELRQKQHLEEIQQRRSKMEQERAEAEARERAVAEASAMQARVVYIYGKQSHALDEQIANVAVRTDPLYVSGKLVPPTSTGYEGVQLQGASHLVAMAPPAVLDLELAGVEVTWLRNGTIGTNRTSGELGFWRGRVQAAVGNGSNKLSRFTFRREQSAGLLSEHHSATVLISNFPPVSSDHALSLWKKHRVREGDLIA